MWTLWKIISISQQNVQVTKSVYITTNNWILSFSWVYVGVSKLQDTCSKTMKTTFGHESLRADWFYKGYRNSIMTRDLTAI